MSYSAAYNKAIKYNHNNVNLDSFYATLGKDPENAESHLPALVDFTEENEHPLAPLYKKLYETRNESPADWKLDRLNSVYHAGHSSKWYPTAIDEKFPNGMVQHTFVPLKNGKIKVSFSAGDYRANGTNEHKKYRTETQVTPEEAAVYIKALGDAGHNHYWTNNSETFAGGMPDDASVRHAVTPDEAVERLKFNVREHGH